MGTFFRDQECLFDSSTMAHFEQNERAYLKQPGVFEYGKHRRGVATSKRERTTRHVHKTALGFKTPKMAIEGKYIDRKCPWVGNVSIRGRILKGRVLSTKMNKTLILRRDSLHYVKKYQRYGEAPRQHGRARQPGLYGEGGRRGHGGRVPPAGQDGQVQCAAGRAPHHGLSAGQEALPALLDCV